MTTFFEVGITPGPTGVAMLPSCFEPGSSQAVSESLNDVLLGSNSGILSGGFQGNANNFDLYDMAPVLSGSNTGNSLGLYLGNANNWDIYEVPKDERNQNVITNTNQEADQSVSLVDWNWFPLPPPVVPDVVEIRHLSRYKKVYSFTRYQPVRTKLFRR